VDSVGDRITSGAPFLGYFGLSRPYRFERVLVAGLAVLLALLAVAAALWLRLAGELALSGPRGEYFLYLLILLALVVALLRWPWLAGVVLALAAFELAGGAGLFALHRAGYAAASLMPPTQSEPQRFQWHALLQAVPIPSLALTSRTGLAIRHTAEGTRGKDPTGNLERRNVVATFGGSATYDIGAGEGDSWSDRLAEALDQGSDKERFFIVNHGVPGYSTVEHLIQTALYQTKFGKLPRCAIYYVGWNDLRNAHIPNLDPGYADFHLPSQIDTQKLRRVGGSQVTISPLLTLALRFVDANVDTVRYSVDPYALAPVTGDDSNLEALYQRNIRAISAINRQRGVVTIWVGQLLNRERLTGEGLYGWLPLVRDGDLWPLQQKFNAILERTAKELGDIYIAAPPQSFVAADFVDQGHFSPRGARRFAETLAPVVRGACR
jgi:lysophospholipase L1-like esterase